MRLLDSIIGLFAPATCVTCGKEGLVLCEECSLTTENPSMCYRCKKPSLGGLTCSGCRKHTSITACITYGIYKDSVKDLIGNAKYGPSRVACQQMGTLLSHELPYIPKDATLVTFAPTTASRVRERGFDQARLLAKRLGYVQKLPVISLLRRTTESHQVGASKKERIEHMRGGFEMRAGKRLGGETIILVDDVITTGATLESASRTLRRAGAGTIIVAVVARAI